MKRFLFSLLVFFALLLPANAAKPSLLDSVRGLMAHTPEGDRVVCTVGNVWKDAYLTAAHCYDETMEPYTIEGKPAKVGKVDRQKDLAIFYAKAGGKPLKLAYSPLDWDDAVSTIGRPRGMVPLFFRGRVANPSVTFEDHKTYVVFDLNVAHMQSGSPIVNEKGELASVMQIGFLSPMEVFSPVAGGALLTDIEQFLNEQ